jgi:hypothetical protein
MVLANKEANLAIGVELDPLGIGIVPVANRDLSNDSSTVVLVTMGLDGKLKFLISLS